MRRSGGRQGSRALGFVPCAVGGSSLSEWLPSAAAPAPDQAYAFRQDDDSGPGGGDGGGGGGGGRGSDGRGSGALNFFEAAVLRTRAALASWPPGGCSGGGVVVKKRGVEGGGGGGGGGGEEEEEEEGEGGEKRGIEGGGGGGGGGGGRAVLAGVLWYQGETDAMDAGAAAAYEARFRSLVAALRARLPQAPQASRPGALRPGALVVPVPLIAVAPTAVRLGGRSGLPGLGDVRGALLGLAPPGPPAANQPAAPPPLVVLTEASAASAAARAAPLGKSEAASSHPTAVPLEESAATSSHLPAYVWTLHGHCSQPAALLLAPCLVLHHSVDPVNCVRDLQITCVPASCDALARAVS